MKSEFIKSNYKNYRFYIALGIVLIFLFISIFVFKNSYVRIAEAFKDLGLSIAYYFCKICGIDNNIDVSVIDISNINLSDSIPVSWSAFQIKIQDFGNAIITLNNFENYALKLANGLFFVIVFAIPVIFLLCIIIIYFKQSNQTVNNDYNQDSIPLAVYRKVSMKIFIPVRYFVLELAEYLKSNNFIFKILLFIAFISFNVITILVELISYLLYFFVSMDIVSIYTQFYKLFVDFTVFFKVPIYLWIPFIFVVISYLRKKIGYAKLSHNEAKNCGFVKELAICTLFDSVMGSGKTKSITDISLSLSVIFRDEAKRLMREIETVFPNFPFIVFENFLKNHYKKGDIYNLYTTEKLIKKIEKNFEILQFNSKAADYIKNRYVSEDFKVSINCFEYDYLSYGLNCDNGLIKEYLFDCLADYAKLYFIYVINSSLIYSNYAIRSDDVKEDYGNFPKYDNDFFHRKSIDKKEKNTYSHILDFDMLRLGKKMFEVSKQYFEFGIFSIMEIDKERGNMLDTMELRKMTDVCNQKNDLFNGTIKMSRHPAVIRNFAFVRFLMDTQRINSLNADLRGLCVCENIIESSAPKLLMPCFWFGEFIHMFLYPKFLKVYDDYRLHRGDNTLFIHLLKNCCSYFERKYNYYYNVFGCITEKIAIRAGEDIEKVKEKRYYIQPKKIYSARYSTDALSGYFKERSRKADFGIEAVKCYETLTASVEELVSQNSHFVNEIMSNIK